MMLETECTMQSPEEAAQETQHSRSAETPDVLGEMKAALYASVLKGRSKDTERIAGEALQAGLDAQALVREAMIPAMREVGSEFQMNDADLPRILSAARCMRKGLQVLEPALERVGGMHIGAAILGTVEGDLHEIGKNLVAIMFGCSGFDVIDLGVDVSEKQFLRALREHPEADLVCISSLLTTSNGHLRHLVASIRAASAGRKLFVMVGGGSVTEALAREIGADAYTENAVDAAQAARRLVTGEQA